MAVAAAGLAVVVARRADRSARELAVSQSTNQAIIEHASDAIIATGPDGLTVTVWNPAAERLFGWSASEVLGRPLPTVDSPELKAEREALLNEVRSGGTATLRTRRRHKDGHEVDVRVAYSALTDERGQFAGWMGMLEDATAEATQAADAAQRAELVEELARVIGDLTRRLDLDSVLSSIAESAAQLLGAPAAGYVRIDEDGAGEILAVHGIPVDIVGTRIPAGSGVLGDLRADTPPVVIANYHDLPPTQPELTALMHDLSTVVIAPSGLDGRLVGILCIAWHEPHRPVSDTELDVVSLLAGHASTAIANATAYREAVLREMHERHVIEALADGVAVIDPEGLVTSWNSSAARITGIPAEEAVGRPVQLPTGSPGEPLEHRVSDDCWIEILSSPLPLTGETVLAIRDVSHQRALEEAKSLFLATTTHEFKTPITVINGFAMTLLKRWDTVPNEFREEALEAIVRRANALVKLIDQLLLGWRAEAGQLQLDLAAFELEPALQIAAAGFESVSDMHALEVLVPDGLPLVVGDRRAAEQVVGQLLENALKYSPDGGTIRLRAEPRSDLVAVQVSDEGIGIGPDDAERIFSRYYRSEHTVAGTSGVGLGLFIVRSLVEAQGGTVKATGQPGKGTTIEFTLPRADAT